MDRWCKSGFGWMYQFFSITCNSYLTKGHSNRIKVRKREMGDMDIANYQRIMRANVEGISRDHDRVCLHGSRLPGKDMSCRGGIFL